MVKRGLWMLVLVASALSLSACAEKGPVLLEGVSYQTPEGKPAGTPKIVVGVSPFKDERGKTSSVLGKRTIRDDVENDLVVQGTVSNLVTAAVKDALTARGVAVKDAPAWDLSEGTIPQAGTDIVIGGEIKAFWVDALSQPLNVKVNAVVQLRVAAADTKEKKVFRTLVLNSKVEREDVVFSFDNVTEALSEALTGAIDQLMKDDEFKKRIQ
jgi:hypothetical protein